MAAKKWIGAINNGAGPKKGALHKALGVPEGTKIPAKKLDKAAKEGGKIGKEANLAKTFKKFSKGK